MKRVAVVLLTLLAMFGALLALAPVLVPTELVRERLIEQIAQWTGREVITAGEPSISLYPRPTVRVEGVTIADIDGSGRPFITVAELRGTAALLPLLFGRVEMREFELIRPTIALRVDAEGRANWTLTGGTVGAQVAEALTHAEPVAAEVALGRFIIRQGTITYQVADGEPVAFADVALDLAWSSTSGAASARGGFVWRGERIELNASLGRPLDLIGQRVSPARFTLDTALIHIAFDGAVGRTGLDFRLAGATDVSMPSLRRTLRWIGLAMVESPTLGPAAITAEASWSWPVLSFADAEMALDGNEAAGAFAVDFAGERVSIRGTIAAAQLDLTLYADAFRSDIQAGGAWTATPISLPALTLVDSDLRLSAGQMTIGAARIDRLAASAVVNDGRYLITIGEALLYGGRMSASAVGEVRDGFLRTDVRMEVADMAILPAFTDLLGVAAVSGVGSGIVRMSGEGGAWGELVEGLTGTFGATISNGSLRGVDLEAAAAMPNPTVQALLGGSATEFTRFEADFRFDGGRMETERFVAAGPAFDLAFAGGASLLRPTIDGHGWIWLKPRGAGPQLSLPFVLSGTWFEPVLAEDPTPLVVSQAAPAPAAP